MRLLPDYFAQVLSTPQTCPTNRDHCTSCSYTLRTCTFKYQSITLTVVMYTSYLPVQVSGPRMNWHNWPRLKAWEELSIFLLISVYMSMLAGKRNMTKPKRIHMYKCHRIELKWKCKGREGMSHGQSISKAPMRLWLMLLHRKIWNRLCRARAGLRSMSKVCFEDSGPLHFLTSIDTLWEMAFTLEDICFNSLVVSVR